MLSIVMVVVVVMVAGPFVVALLESPDCPPTQHIVRRAPHAREGQR